MPPTTPPISAAPACCISLPPPSRDKPPMTLRPWRMWLRCRIGGHASPTVPTMPGSCAMAREGAEAHHPYPRAIALRHPQRAPVRFVVLRAHGVGSAGEAISPNGRVGIPAQRISPAMGSVTICAACAGPSRA